LTSICANDGDFSVFASTNYFVSFGVYTGNRLSENLDLLSNLSLFVPDKNYTLICSDIAPAFFIKSHAIVLHCAHLEGALHVQLFGNISRVPETEIFSTDSSKAQVVRSLGPLNVVDLVFATRRGQKHGLALYVVNENLVVIRLVHGGDVLFARTN